MIAVCVEAIDFAAPGVVGWDDACAALSEGREPALDPSWAPMPCFLAPRQARRLSPATRLAMTLANGIAPALPEDSAWVFASSLGEGETLAVILDALCDGDIMLQPLRFQNAVHNAASGQWSIARGLKGPATSIAAFDHTAGAGLLKAAMQCVFEQRPVGLVVYDAPIPAPLHEKRPIACAAGAALALSPATDTRGKPVLTLSIDDTGREATTPASPLSRMLGDAVHPVAGLMPLLEALHARRDRALIEQDGPPISIGIAYD